MSKATAQVCVYLALFILIGFSLATGAFAQTQLFTPGNLVVAVEGCGVHAGTCTSVPNGSGNGSGNSAISRGLV